MNLFEVRFITQTAARDRKAAETNGELASYDHTVLRK